MDLHNLHLPLLSANLACVCTNPTFVSAATKCIQSNCTSAERTEALQLQVADCSSKWSLITTGRCTYMRLLSLEQYQYGNSDIRCCISNRVQFKRQYGNRSVRIQKFNRSHSRSRHLCWVVVISHCQGCC
jgi:hypothetical protein